MKNITKHLIKWFMIVIGLSIIFITHILMLVMGLPESQHITHAMLNLIGGTLLLISSFIRR